MATKSSPKTPPSTRRLGRHDPETTPTRKRAHASAALYADTRWPRTPPRRNSFEEMEVTALPDPRTPEHISFNDVWKGSFLEDSRSAVRMFLSELETLLARANRLPEFNHFFGMLQGSARHASVDLDLILDRACTLFGRNAELVHLFNEILPPGFRMETHPNYIAVFTPDGGWTADRDGERIRYPAIQWS
ncbi:hypothetical protein C2E23DRAFT_888043 [Lenzites betulinus]|nr:hypothetical protein C2E23DRAFT_888043 [Lenzites betulinus]